MQVFEVYGKNVHAVNMLEPTALYELAAPKTPLEVREEVEKVSVESLVAQLQDAMDRNNRVTEARVKREALFREAQRNRADGADTPLTRASLAHTARSTGQATVMARPLQSL